MLIRKVLGTTLGYALVLGCLVALPVVAAHAGSHTWDVNEVFSDSTGNIQFIELLEKNAEFIGAPGNTFCLHATGAMEPMNSALKYFRAEFEAHIEQGGCPLRHKAG